MSEEEVVSVNLTPFHEDFRGCHVNAKLIRKYGNGRVRVIAEGTNLPSIIVPKKKIRPAIRRRKGFPRKYAPGARVLAKDNELPGWWEGVVIKSTPLRVRVRWRYEYEDGAEEQWVLEKDVVPARKVS